MQRRELLIEEIGEGSYRLYNQRSKHIMADNITFGDLVEQLLAIERKYRASPKITHEGEMAEDASHLLDLFSKGEI